MVILQYGTDTLTNLKIIRMRMQYAKCPDPALIRDVDPKDKLHQCRFPASGFTCNGNDFSWIECQRHPADYRIFPSLVAEDDVLKY